MYKTAVKITLFIKPTAYLKFCTQILLIIFTSFLIVFSVQAQSNGSLPVAITVPVSGVSGQGGLVVVYNEGSRTYSVSRVQGDASVYGVTVEQPPLVFSTATNTVPVVTNGAAYVRINNSAGPVSRGDLLVTSSQTGVAAKALPEDENVFAVALEDSPGLGANAGVLAQIDIVRAKALLAERREAAEKDEEEAGGLFGTGDGDGVTEEEEEKGFFRHIIEEYSRATLASIIAIGSLFFIMYTFRTTIINATQAVGRNPRARNAIMTVSVENIIFALVICLVAIFIAIAVLVLPIE